MTDYQHITTDTPMTTDYISHDGKRFLPASPERPPLARNATPPPNTKP